MEQGGGINNIATAAESRWARPAVPLWSSGCSLIRTRSSKLVKYDGMSNTCQLDDGSWLATEGMSNRCQLDDGKRLAMENLLDAARASVTTLRLHTGIF